MNTYARRELILRAAAHAENVRIACTVARTASVDPLLLAEKRDCEVRFMSLPSLEGVYSPTPRSVIILGSQRPRGRRAFTCAHELGHHEFKHGARVEELNNGRFQRNKDPDEFLADMFAAFLLMSQGSVRRAFKDRQIQPNRVEPMQVFRLSCYFGVGYSTLIDHMSLTLGLLLPNQRERLLQTQPKELKANFGGAPYSEVVLVDEFWRDRAVDLEIGDILVLYKGVVVEDGPRLTPHGTIDGQEMFKAAARGYIRAFHNNSDWAVNIRIAPKHYEGLARYRFLEDPEESTQ
ncbi:MAG: ImmA/IrrE family metallo-endopeptidase [Deltaproteobacteria bacterium]|nr:ImmA/IrrE family metallo-endopeptidase [Deltaproteobacteria bacterium]